MQVNIGDKVASPYRRNRFDPAPYVGLVLSPSDPKAWIGTVAGERLKTQDDIAAHVAHVAHFQINGLLDDSLPVLWNFEGKPQVFWERRNTLVSYETEVTEWLKARH